MNCDIGELDLVKCSDRIRNLRQCHGESHATLGSAISISEQMLKEYEQASIQGENAINARAKKVGGMSIKTLWKIAEHYNVSADYLLGLSDAKTRDTNILSICSLTGLSEQSVMLLMRKSERNRDIDKIIQALCSTEEV